MLAAMVFVAFVANIGSQPMQLAGADGMTYWQFVRERIGAIRDLPAKCQQLHFTGYLIAVPFYPHKIPITKLPKPTLQDFYFLRTRFVNPQFIK